MLHNSEAQAYDVVSCGLDWLTLTAKWSEQGAALEREANSELQRQWRTGVNLLPQNRLGFEGYKAEHFFMGRREKDFMVQLSGDLADQLGKTMIPLSSNCSRIDYQVTVFTGGEVVQLALEGYKRLKTMDHVNGRPKSFSLIVNHPAGQTLYIGSRSSDNFGRGYDKGVESGACEAGLLWRFEVEFKRAVAQQRSWQYVRSERPKAHVAASVHSWLTKRGLEPPFPVDGNYADVDEGPQALDRDVLTWFDSSVSKTVAKAVKRYGLAQVLKSLHLHKLVQPIGEINHGDTRTRANSLSYNTGPTVARADDPERLLLN